MTDQPPRHQSDDPAKPIRRERMTAYYNDTDAFCCRWLENLQREELIPHGRIDPRSIADVGADDLAEVRQAHFFAGVGGWPLALELAGWGDRSVWTGSCPCQPFSTAGKQKGTQDERHLWPEFFRIIEECRPPIVFGEQVASAEVVGTRTEAAFLVAVQRGDYALANKLAKRLVAGKSFHYHPRWVDGIQRDLAGIGYAFGCKVLGAHSVGAPHIRQRVFWVAVAGCCNDERWGQSGKTLGSAGEAQGEAPERERGGHAARRGVQADRLGEPFGAGLQPRREATSPTGHGSPAESASGGLGDLCGTRLPLGAVEQDRRGTARSEGPTAFVACTPWDRYRIIECRDEKRRRISAEPGDEPLAHGIPLKLGPRLAGLGRVAVRPARANRAGRLRAYGNSIVPQIAAVFVRAVMEIET